MILHAIKLQKNEMTSFSKQKCNVHVNYSRFCLSCGKKFPCRLKLSISVLMLSLYLGYKCSAKDTINDVVAEQTKNGNGKLVLVTLSTFFDWIQRKKHACFLCGVYSSCKMLYLTWHSRKIVLQGTNR